MAEWTCTRCSAVNRWGQVICEGCGAETSGARAASPSPGPKLLTMPTERPLTDAQNKAAWRIVMDVMERKCEAAEGRKRLAELFAMPELVEMDA